MSIVTVVAFVVVLSLLILLHELGHFLTAKQAGIRVDEFGLGYPPRLLSLGRHGGTEYTLNWLPLGGFVRMAGEEDPDVPGSLASKSAWARLVVLGAGALMNFLAAVVVFALMYVSGAPEPVAFERVVVVSVEDESPAGAAGLQGGDQIVAVDGQPIRSPDDLTTLIDGRLGQEVVLELERSGETRSVTLVPRPEWPEDQGPMGVVIRPDVSKIETRRYPWWQSLFLGLQQTVFYMGLTLMIPVLLLRGGVAASIARPVGPVGIARLGSTAAQQAIVAGWWFPLLQVTGVVSTGLCLANLLPIPGLDGGRIIFVLIEAIRGRRIDPEKARMVHIIGMAALLVLMVIITFQDVFSPVPGVDWSSFPTSTP